MGSNVVKALTLKKRRQCDHATRLQGENKSRRLLWEAEKEKMISEFGEKENLWRNRIIACEACHEDVDDFVKKCDSINTEGNTEKPVPKHSTYAADINLFTPLVSSSEISDSNPVFSDFPEIFCPSAQDDRTKAALVTITTMLFDSTKRLGAAQREIERQRVSIRQITKGKGDMLADLQNKCSELHAKIQSQNIDLTLLNQTLNSLLDLGNIEFKETDFPMLISQQALIEEYKTKISEMETTLSNKGLLKVIQKCANQRNNLTENAATISERNSRIKKLETQVKELELGISEYRAKLDAHRCPRTFGEFCGDAEAELVVLENEVLGVIETLKTQLWIWTKKCDELEAKVNASKTVQNDFGCMTEIGPSYAYAVVQTDASYQGKIF